MNHRRLSPLVEIQTHEEKKWQMHNDVQRYQLTTKTVWDVLSRCECLHRSPASRTLTCGTKVTKRIFSMWPWRLKKSQKNESCLLCVINSQLHTIHCVIVMVLVFLEVTGIKTQRSLQVTGVQPAAAEAGSAAHHSRQSQDSKQDGPPMSLRKQILWDVTF